MTKVSNYPNNTQIYLYIMSDNPDIKKLLDQMISLQVSDPSGLDKIMQLMLRISNAYKALHEAQKAFAEISDEINAYGLESFRITLERGKEGLPRDKELKQDESTLAQIKQKLETDKSLKCSEQCVLAIYILSAELPNAPLNSRSVNDLVESVTKNRIVNISSALKPLKQSGIIKENDDKTLEVINPSFANKLKMIMGIKGLEI